MPMEREKHEEILGKLLNPDIEHSERTELLQALRADYSGVHSEFGEISKNNERLMKDNDDLIKSNSKLFRLAGVMDDEPKKEVEQKKEFSETISIEELERGVNT